MVTTAYEDASFATNKKTRKSHSVFLSFVNEAPTWFSKRQLTVETSTFSAECISMKSCLNAIDTLRFKLRMFGVPFEGPTDVYCDSEKVVLNSSKVESILDKKHNSVAFYNIFNSDSKHFICGKDC